ncbi:unnamed protein product [Camellia sinensis]
MVEIAHMIGYSHDLSQQRRLVNEELLKLPMSTTQRLMAASIIVKDEDKVDLFFSLDENDKMKWDFVGCGLVWLIVTHRLPTLPTLPLVLFIKFCCACKTKLSEYILEFWATKPLELLRD